MRVVAERRYNLSLGREPVRITNPRSDRYAVPTRLAPSAFLSHGLAPEAKVVPSLRDCGVGRC